MNPHQDEPIYLPTAFHSRQQQHNLLHAWGGWNGYLKPEAYTDIELEYFAIRSTTAVFDLSPMNKYRVTGPDAEAFLNRVLTRDVAKIKSGRVGYCIWCDDAGQVMDDGTLFHLGDNDYRLCSYTRAYEWLYWSSLGFDVAIEDETGTVAALACDDGAAVCEAFRTTVTRWRTTRIHQSSVGNLRRLSNTQIPERKRRVPKRTTCKSSNTQNAQHAQRARCKRLRETHNIH